MLLPAFPPETSLSLSLSQASAADADADEVLSTSAYPSRHLLLHLGFPRSHLITAREGIVEAVCSDLVFEIGEGGAREEPGKGGGTECQDQGPTHGGGAQAPETSPQEGEKGSPEEFATRSDLVAALPHRIQSIPDGTSGGGVNQNAKT